MKPKPKSVSLHCALYVFDLLGPAGEQGLLSKDMAPQLHVTPRRVNQIMAILKRVFAIPGKLGVLYQVRGDDGKYRWILDKGAAHFWFDHHGTWGAQ